MALQVFAYAAAAARQIETTLLHAQGKQIVICSVHGQMIVNWDGPAPQPSQQKPKGACPACLIGWTSAAAHMPDAILDKLSHTVYDKTAIKAVALVAFEIPVKRFLTGAARPRGPPARAA